MRIAVYHFQLRFDVQDPNKKSPKSHKKLEIKKLCNEEKQLNKLELIFSDRL